MSLFSIKLSVGFEAEVSPSVIFYCGALWVTKLTAQRVMKGEYKRSRDRDTHQAEVISVNMVALGIHIPRHDMVPIT